MVQCAGIPKHTCSHTASSVLQAHDWWVLVVVPGIRAGGAARWCRWGSLLFCCFWEQLHRCVGQLTSSRGSWNHTITWSHTNPSCEARTHTVAATISILWELPTATGVAGVNNNGGSSQAFHSCCCSTSYIRTGECISSGKEQRTAGLMVEWRWDLFCCRRQKKQETRLIVNHSFMAKTKLCVWCMIQATFVTCSDL